MEGSYYLFFLSSTLIAMHPRRLLTILSSCIVSLQVCFLLAAHYHLETHHHNAGGLHDFYRRQKMRKYKPDYSKFNTSHPPIVYASSPGSLSSLPDANRIPQHIIERSQNFSQYFSNYDPTIDPPMLFVYNPSIVQLFSSKSFSSYGDDIIAQQNFQYLATFRVSSIHSCGFSTYDFWNHPIEYLGIAILDDRLQVATTRANLDDGSVVDSSLDIIVDLNSELPKIFGSQWITKQRKRLLQDVRLFYIHDKVFLSCEAYLIPICVKISENTTNQGIETNIPTSSAICTHGDNKLLEEIPALYRKNNHLRLFVTGDAIHIQGAAGKNFQFISSLLVSNQKDDDAISFMQRTNVLMEFYPTLPRVIHDLGNEIENVYLLKDNQEDSKNIHVVDIRRLREIESSVHPDPISNVSKSLDASLKRFINRDRGSA